MFSRDLTVLPANPHVHSDYMFNPQSELTIPAFDFPAIAGTHLLTTEGWKAELAWVAGVVTQNTSTIAEINSCLFKPHLKNWPMVKSHSTIVNLYKS